MRVEQLIRSVSLPQGREPAAGHPWDLPVVGALADGLALHPKVTYLIGENGSGKSTLLEAIAIAAGMNPEGGSSNFTFPSPEDEPGAARHFAFSRNAARAELGRNLRLARGGRRPRTDFFLRAESLFTAATYLEGLPGNPLRAYGGVSLHAQSHGQGFLAIMIERFGPNGLYLLDEPEAALSTQNCLTCLRRIHELADQGSQFIIATHSPIILAYPDATIYACTDDGLTVVPWDEADPVVLTRSFLGAPGRFLRELLAD